MHAHTYREAHAHLYSFLSSLPSLFYHLAFHSKSRNSAQSNGNLTVLHMYVLFYTTISFGYLPAHLIPPIHMTLFSEFTVHSNFSKFWSNIKRMVCICHCVYCVISIWKYIFMHINLKGKSHVDVFLVFLTLTGIL